MDFDRDAIGSLEDLQREWDGLENERAKVEDKLRSFDAAGRGGSGWRGGRGGGRGRGVGSIGGRGAGLGGRASTAGGDWPRDRPRDNNAMPQQQKTQPYVSREKYRAMAGKWQRGLDPDKAAEEEQAEADSSYRPAEKGQDAEGRGGALTRRGGGDRDGAGRGTRERFRATPGKEDLRNDLRNDIRNSRRNDLRSTLGNSLRNGAVMGNRGGAGDSLGSGASGRETRGRRELESRRGVGNGGDGGGGGSGDEPVPKRPRVTSAIVVAANDDGEGEGGELDRWDAGLAPMMEEGEQEQGQQKEQEKHEREDATTAPEENEGPTDEKEGIMTAPERGDEEADDPYAAADDGGSGGEGEGKGELLPRFTGKIVVVPGARGRAARDPAAAPRFRGDRSFLERIGERGGPGPGVGVGRRLAIRPSLASRLGPAVGAPQGGFVEEEGEDAEEDAPAPRPMPEPTKPELQTAYKDGDTKNRNRRMFGGLMAHLGRARQRLDQDKTLIERQNSLAEMAAVRQAQEKRRQRQMAIEAARKERDDELHKRDYITARQQKALIALYGNAFIANQEQLKGAIFTKALPQLAWSPNEHTDGTQALLVESNREIDARIAKRKEADDLSFLEIDDSVDKRAAARVNRRQAGRQNFSVRDGSSRSPRVVVDGTGGRDHDRWGGAAASQADADPDDEHHYNQAGVRRKRAHGDSTEGQHDVLREGDDDDHEHYLDGGGANDGAAAEADDRGAPTGNGIDYDVFVRGNDDHDENDGSGGGGGGLGDGDDVTEGASNHAKQEGYGQEEKEIQVRMQEEVGPLHGTMKVRDGDGRGGIAEKVEHRRGEQDERKGHYYDAGHKKLVSGSEEGQNNEELPRGEPKSENDDAAEKERGWGEVGERGGADEAGGAISRVAPIKEEALVMVAGGVGEARDGGGEVFAATNARADMLASAYEEEDDKGKEGLQQRQQLRRLAETEEDQQQQEQKQQEQEQQQRQQRRHQQREREEGGKKARKERKRSGKEGRARSRSDGGGHASDDRDGRVTRSGLDAGNDDTIASTIIVKKDESDDDNADFARDGRREEKRRGEKKKVKKKEKKKGKRR